MQHIDIRQIVQSASLDWGAVASELFPTNKHPKMSLKCVEDGTQFLDSNQLMKLAEMAGCSVNDLYSVENWTYTMQEKIFTFVKGDYTVKLDSENWTTSVYKGGAMEVQKVLHKSSITLSAYIQDIETLIKSNK